ncbi:dATP/dGTP diphosphohydrolase domain-containing protein, partial [Cutibacterium acnes]
MEEELELEKVYQGYRGPYGWIIPSAMGNFEYDPASFEVVVEGPALIGAGGMKYDGGKARMALLFDGCPNALEAVGQVLTFGAQKYAAHSWQTVPEGEERYKSALLRHLLAVGKGEAIDPESNLHHLAHAACNALFILELELRKQNA